MAVKLLPILNDAPYLDSNGNPLSGGLCYTYVAGSSTPADTFTTSVGNVANANPIELGSGGYPTLSGNIVQVWGTVGVSYKLILKTAAGVTIWTRDNIDPINDVSTDSSQWETGPAPTFISTTSFSLVGDQTADFQVGRRVWTTNSGGAIYGRIKSSVFGAVTTVTVVNDSGVLDAGLSAVSLGLLTPTNPSTPVLTDAYPVMSGSSDKTKLLRFEIDGFTTDTTRTITVPDASGTMLTSANTSVAYLDVAQSWTKAQRGAVVALTSTSNSIAVDLSLANNYSHTLTEDTTLAAPSNVVAGQSGLITFTQHASSPKTLAYNTFWKFQAGVVPTLTASNGAVDVFAYYVNATGYATCSLMKGIA